ncbi:type 1 fimbrial protein [Citrobacter sp. Cb003]|uniref:fimbrial protein n=1 Tax=Citrobacter sp. Cb003 TaxID=2985005 RepID=UPI00257D4DF6|nr:fimbrial protein [Citrobacter sp. Cb003]MDM3379288.1 type 1 fimbrial protein [Citrobacter sp. Cb003]
MKWTNGVITLAMWSLAGLTCANGIDGLNGTVRATGSMVASPCILAPESVEQEIDFGMTGINRLNIPGTVTTPVPVHLILDHCPGERYIVHETQRGGQQTLISGQQAVMLKIIADGDPHDGRFIRVNGSASGVAIRLEDSAGRLLTPGMRSRPQMLNPGRNDLVLHAQLLRTEAPLEPGDWQSTINIGLEYE